MTQERFNEMAGRWLESLGKLLPSDWSAEARSWAEAAGLIQGDGAGNYQYKRPLTLGGIRGHGIPQTGGPGMKQKLAQLLTVKSIVTMTWACIVSRSSSTCVKATYTDVCRGPADAPG